MAKEFKDRVDVTDGQDGVTITLNGNRGAIYAGGNDKNGYLALRDEGDLERVNLGAGGRLLIRDANGEPIFELDGVEGGLVFHDAEGRRVLRFLSQRGTLELGDSGKAGHLSIRDREGERVFEQDGAEGTLRVGGQGRAGKGDFTDSQGRSTVHLDGDSATFKLGADGKAGDLKVLDEDGGLLFQVSASFARLRGAFIVGARDHKGEIGIMGPMGRPAIHADGGTARLQLGNLGNAGDFVILDNDSNPVLGFNGLTSTLELGGEGKPGYLVLKNDQGDEAVRLSGKEAGLFLGGQGRAGEVLLLNAQGKSALWVDGANSAVKVGTGDTEVILDGKEGDIRLGGADCAEAFASLGGASLEAGTVVVIAGETALAESTQPYDKRVAGVVSGGGGSRPGIILNQRSGSEECVPVALNGRVYCRVDADAAPIEIGDLLTTSATRGHAMKACEPAKSHGAVLGKALGSLERGTGLIPVLVCLI